VSLTDSNEPTPSECYDSERHLLAALIQSSTARGEILPKMSRGDFHRPSHEVIAGAIADLDAEGNGVDAVLLADHLGDDLGRAGGRVAIFELNGLLVIPANADQHLHIVQKSKRRRELSAVAVRLQQAATTNADLTSALNTAAIDLATIANLCAPPTTGQMTVQSYPSLAAEVDAQGPRRFLVRGLIVEGDYGVHGAEPKAGKTWNGADLAVSVATGTPFLNRFEIDAPGPVIMFVGEGGKGNITRRIRAITEHRGLTDNDLTDLHVSARAPHLADPDVLKELACLVTTIAPKLVIVDPFYLAGRGANGADLYAMGELLEGPQHICQDAGASLLVITHFNRNRETRGAARITGAGPAEWARFLLASTVLSRQTDPTSKATTIVTEMEVTGGELPDAKIHVRRKVWADDPEDLDSCMHYEVDTMDAAEPFRALPNDSGLAPAAVRLLAAMEGLDKPAAIPELVDWIVAKYGFGLKRPTCSTHLNKLLSLGLIDYIDAGTGTGKFWFKVESETPAVVAA
jgi:hypothetical protein